MTPEERRKRIVAMVRQRGRASVEELARTLSASRETIRRDLTALASRGLIQKFHGGAAMPVGEGPFRVRMTEQAEQKARIAQAAARLVTPGETLFIDTGSTTIYFAEELAHVANLTVFTNSTEVAHIIARAGNGSQAFVLGGLYNPDNRQTVGAVALEQIRGLHARYAFLTVGAINAKNGATDFNLEEASIARAMLDQADRLIVLADSSKLGRAATFQVCALERIDTLVTDGAPPAALAGTFAEARIEVVSA
ncbi:MAG TPA: DeoR/GlpR transcriptional regulator [Thermopetrobacter sp.]|nr:DeoR/GlpR transcriptional regulator [Thermopetrobacter sp.]